MKKEEMQIGLALSGGGMRAAVYHLGILQAMAEVGLLSRITRISSVSGASICIGLIFSCNHQVWPSDQEFIDTVLPKVRKLITSKDIQWTSLIKWLCMPYYWDKKVNLLSEVMEKKWGIHCCLQSIPDKPLWIINTTAFETGKDFRISTQRMGSNNLFVMRPAFRMSHAMGASASFPILIGPYKLKTKKYIWTDRNGIIKDTPDDKILHLWDGGVYDNMGLDPIFKIKDDGKMPHDINYMLVSNASGDIEHQSRKRGYSFRNLKRMLDINMDQVESLKTRVVTQYMKKNHNGLYFKIGTPVKDIVKHSDLSFAMKEHWIHSSMHMKDIVYVRDYKTTLEKVKLEHFNMILRHGYETARTTLHCYGHFD